MATEEEQLIEQLYFSYGYTLISLAPTGMQTTALWQFFQGCEMLIRKCK